MGPARLDDPLQRTPVDPPLREVRPLAPVQATRDLWPVRAARGGVFRLGVLVVLERATKKLIDSRN
jgi:hypothetical protein